MIRKHFNSPVQFVAKLYNVAAARWVGRGVKNYYFGVGIIPEHFP